MLVFQKIFSWVFDNCIFKKSITLTFMNSKLTKMSSKDKQNYIFQKSRSYEISSTDILYIYTYIYIYINVRKTSHLIKGTFSHNICSGIKSQQVKKKPSVIQYQKLLIFLRTPLLHFIESLLTIQCHVCF